MTTELYTQQQPITIIAPTPDRAALLNDYDDAIDALSKELVSLNVARAQCGDAERRVEVARQRCRLAQLALEGC